MNKRKDIFILLAAVASTTLFLFFLNMVLRDHVFKDLIAKVVEQETEGRYVLELADIDYNLITRDLTLHNVFIATNPSNANTDSIRKDTTLKFALKKADIDGFNLLSLLIHHKFEFTKIILEKPVINACRQVHKNHARANRKKWYSEVLAPFARLLDKGRIKELRIDHGRMQLYEPDCPDSAYFMLERFDLHVHDLSIEMDAREGWHITDLTWSDLVMDFGKYALIMPSKDLRLDVDGFAYDDGREILDVSGFHLTTIHKNDAMAGSQDFLHIPDISLSGISVKDVAGKAAIRVGNVHVSNPELEIVADNFLASGTEYPRNTSHHIVQNYIDRMQVDTVRLSKGKIRIDLRGGNEMFAGSLDLILTDLMADTLTNGPDPRYLLSRCILIRAYDLRASLRGQENGRIDTLEYNRVARTMVLTGAQMNMPGENHVPSASFKADFPEISLKEFFIERCWGRDTIFLGDVAFQYPDIRFCLPRENDSGSYAGNDARESGNIVFPELSLKGLALLDGNVIMRCQDKEQFLVSGAFDVEMDGQVLDLHGKDVFYDLLTERRLYVNMKNLSVSGVVPDWNFHFSDIKSGPGNKTLDLYGINAYAGTEMHNHGRIGFGKIRLELSDIAGLLENDRMFGYVLVESPEIDLDLSALKVGSDHPAGVMEETHGKAYGIHELELSGGALLLRNFLENGTDGRLKADFKHITLKGLTQNMMTMSWSSIDQLFSGCSMEFSGLFLQMGGKKISLNVQQGKLKHQDHLTLDNIQISQEDDEQGGSDGFLQGSVERFRVKEWHYSRDPGDSIFFIHDLQITNPDFVFRGMKRYAGSWEGKNTSVFRMPVGLSIQNAGLTGGIVNILDPSGNFKTTVSLQFSLEVDKGMRDPLAVFQALDDVVIELQHSEYAGKGFLYGIANADLNTKKDRISIRGLSVNDHPPDSVQEGFSMIFPSVVFSGFSLQEMAEKQILAFDTLSIHDPRVFLKNSRRNRAKDTSFVHRNISGLQKLEIGFLNLENGNLTWDTEPNDHFRKRTHSLDSLCALVKGIRFDFRDGLEPGDKVAFQSFAIDVPGISIPSADSMYTISFSQGRIASGDPGSYVDSLRIIPNYPKVDFSRKLGYQTDRMDVFVKRIHFRGIDHESLLEKKIRVSGVTLKGPSMEAFRDKRVAFPEWQRREFPTKLLREMKFPVYIDSLIISDGYINYSELVEGSKNPGDVFFSDFDAEIHGIGSGSFYGLYDSALVARIRTRIMDAGDLTAILSFPYVDSRDTFVLTATLSSMDLSVFSDMTRNLFGVEIRKGRGRATIPGIYGNNDYSAGKIIFPYKNLRIALYNRKLDKKRGVGSEIIGFLANELIIKSNNPRFLGKLREGEVYAQRNKKRSIFNFIWKSTLSGLESTLGFENKETRRHNRNIEKRDRHP